MDKRNKAKTKRSRIEMSKHFRVKKVLPPKVKITDAENGELRFWTTSKTTPGIYELVLEDGNGNKMVITKVEVLPK
jgi:hypothetical protein